MRGGAAELGGGGGHEVDDAALRQGGREVLADGQAAWSSGEISRF